MSYRPTNRPTIGRRSRGPSLLGPVIAIIIAAMAIIGLSAIVSACSGAPQSVTYVAPTYADYGHDGDCYYLDDPYEVTQLQAAGLCPVGWRPVLVPLDWHLSHAWLYDSPTYINHYVISSHRTRVTTVVHQFESSNKARVITSPPKQRVTVGKASSGGMGTSENGGLSKRQQAKQSSSGKTQSVSVRSSSSSSRRSR